MIALLRMNAGLIAWAAFFCLLYGLHGIGCAAGMEGFRTMLLAVWAAALAAHWVLYAWVRRGGGTSIADRTAGPIAIIGGIATFASGLPIVLVPACL